MYCKHFGSSDLQPFADRICFRRLHHLMRAFANQLLTKFSPIPPNKTTTVIFSKKNLRNTENKTNQIWNPKILQNLVAKWLELALHWYDSGTILPSPGTRWRFVVRPHFRNSIAWGLDPTVAGVINHGFPFRRPAKKTLLPGGGGSFGGRYLRIPDSLSFRGEDVGANQPQWHHWFFVALKKRDLFFCWRVFVHPLEKRTDNQNIFAWLRCSKASSQQIQFPSTCHKRFRKNVNHCNLPHKTLGERYTALLRARKTSTLCNKLGILAFWTLNSTHVLGIFCKRHQLVVLVAECSKMSNQYFSLFKKRSPLNCEWLFLLNLKMKTKLFNLGASKNRDTPKWIVYIINNPIKMDDFGA